MGLRSVTCGRPTLSCPRSCKMTPRDLPATFIKKSQSEVSLTLSVDLTAVFGVQVKQNMIRYEADSYFLASI